MFYDNLKSLCDLKGLKISTIVAECGGALGSISGWKKGAVPNSSIVVSLAMRLNVSTDYLLTGKEFSGQSLTENEKELLENFNKLTERQQLKLIVKAEDMVEQNENN